MALNAAGKNLNIYALLNRSATHLPEIALKEPTSSVELVLVAKVIESSRMVTAGGLRKRQVGFEKIPAPI